MHRHTQRSFCCAGAVPIETDFLGGAPTNFVHFIQLRSEARRDSEGESFRDAVAYHANIMVAAVEVEIELAIQRGVVDERLLLRERSPPNRDRYNSPQNPIV
jgi:hypothetical protein